MPKKIYRVCVAKDGVKPGLLPVLTRGVRELIQNCLFDQLRISNDQIVKDLQDTNKRTEILARFPGIKNWQNPTDMELRELVKQEKCDYSGQGGWSYWVLDEPTCVTGTLELLIIGHQAKLIGSSWDLPFKHPGFKFSEQIVND